MKDEDVDVQILKKDILAMCTKWRRQEATEHFIYMNNPKKASALAIAGTKGQEHKE